MICGAARPAIPPGRFGGVERPATRLREIVSRHPVEQHTVGLTGHRRHLRSERSDDELGVGQVVQLVDPCPHPREGVRAVTATDSQQHPLDRQGQVADPLGDQGRWLAVERDHADAEPDVVGRFRRHGQRRQPIGVRDVVHPERRVTHPLDLGRQLSDDVVIDRRRDPEPASHRSHTLAISRSC